MISKIVKGVVIGSAVGAALMMAADCAVRKKGSRFGKKIIKAIGL